MATMRSIGANRAMETTETTGTGAYALEGPVAGYTDFRSTIATGQKVAYCVQQASYDSNGDLIGMDYEIGIGTLTHGSPDTLARTLVLQSTNGDAAVNWGPGVKTIFATLPAELVPVMLDELGSTDDGRPLVVAPGSRAFMRGNVSLGQQAATTLTIASGAITPDRAAHVVDTQSEASSDDLVSVATTNIADGGLLVLTAAHPARSVVIKHASSPSAGQIFLLTENDYTLNNIRKSICLQRRGDYWVELWRGEGLVPLDSLAGLAQNHLLVGDADGRPAAVSFDTASRLAGRGSTGAFGPLQVLNRASFGNGTIDIAGLKVFSVVKADVFSTGSTSYTDITGLSITLTPKSSASKFILFFAGLLSNSNNGNGTHVQFVRDSTGIGLGSADGSKVQASATTTSSTSSYGDQVTAIHLDEPATADEITYKLQMRVGGGTGYLGRSWGEANNANWGRVPASLIVVEIEGGNQ